MPDPSTISRCIGQTDLGGVLRFAPWVVLVAILAIGGLAVALAARRWAQRDAQREAFTLQDLRDMRARHEISDQEFLALRAAVLGQTARRAVEDPPPAPPDAN